jgi:CRP-like cAMP-binding protein
LPSIPADTLNENHDSTSRGNHPIEDLRNEILLGLPRNESQFIFDRLVKVDLPLSHVLMESAAPITHGYFPNSGMASVLNLLPNGKGVEVGLIGSEGFVGLPLWAGFKTSPNRINVQADGSMFKIEAADLTKSRSRCPHLTKALMQFSQRHALQVTNTAACNRLHEVEERLARWLLLSQDRVKSEELPLTQEFIGQMLGTRRSGVSNAASSLRRRRIIQYSRGRIGIVSRKGLEEASCECYAQMRRQLAVWEAEASEPS